MTLSEAVESTNMTPGSPGHVGEEERRAVLAACEKLRASLETPFELVFRLNSSVCSTLICLKHSLPFQVICIKFL